MSEPTTPIEPNCLTSSECVRRVAKLLEQLDAAGLRYDPAQPPAPDAVENILITDKWSCRTCGATDVSTCPHTGRPHRRYLVRIAQDILRLIGARTGQFVVRPPKMSSSMDGRSRLRSLRRVTMNPQALLLAYYYAIPSCEEVDSLVTECAQHFLVLLGHLNQYGAQGEVSGEYADALLSSTALMWREYSRRIAEGLDLSKITDRQACKDTLLNATKETYLAVAREIRISPSNECLNAFLQLLRVRLGRVAPQEDLDKLEASDQQQQRYDDDEEQAELNRHGKCSLNRTSLLQSSAPPVLLSEGNTSGSDAEAPSPVAIGPPLPPNWYIDEHGRSRPPQVTEEQRRKERFSRMEFRARKAYETVIKVPEQKDDPLKKEVIAALNDAQLGILAEQCNQQPPDLRNVPSFLNLVVEGLLNALPRRLRSRVEQEVRDVLDWRVVRRSVMGSPGNISVLTRYVMGKVAQYGAPAKSEETLSLAERISEDLEKCLPDLGTAVANAFRVMFSSIRQLHEDVAHYSLLYIAPQLRDNAVPFMREFIVECLPSVEKWESSLAFVRRYFNDERVTAWIASPVAASLTIVTESAKRLRGCLVFGLIDLLRSSGCQPNERWHDYPTECFFFEKPIVFFAANAVQECALLLLLSGTVSTIFRAKGMDSATINGILKQLHDKFRRLLSEQLTLSLLKTCVSDLMRKVLVETKPECVLTDAEVQQLNGAVEKMTDTGSTLYMTFEKRIILFIEAVLARGENDPAPLGLVTDSLKQVAALLQRALTLNWEVYRLVYDGLLSHVEQQEASA
ncbi:T-complex protein 11, putative [Trypanosoma equiperdum]|uniref:T-complex protein 11 n=2 Tax=Trypanozoon TaxID=39700 RepID=Q587E2_TRYB2|nr:hypothetical protein, conserved [Trypanosoma brucei brucei TREU927]AAX79235.1 hypothetical protein, conserved [Trypanosoma brucei]AAZ12034.1 hypothetical protein, conserved [Trypanosoma brucei brucei TREU927]SCU66685.1 T-complex protein 11, putative [Trypanosoma equiperdum]